MSIQSTIAELHVPVSSMSFETGGPPTTAEAFGDIFQATAKSELWLTMAWQDIK